ncbi:hypothetical protein SBA4_1790003 [Candidatus Sulfopaludibacter sp. SbA4]|nr:hypothetical protein SBA4_1790003 [Candidatus Sulfopaludibacter sp. SbA4]
MRPVRFLGDSLQCLRDFPKDVRHDAGYQLDKVQRGGQPDDFKPMPAIGKGVGAARRSAGHTQKRHVRLPIRYSYYPLDERREVTLGYAMKKDLACVSHCERGARIRIIGARLATRTERRQYEEGIASYTW